MYEIVTLHGEPFDRPRVERPRRVLFSIKRVAAALLLVLGSLGLAGLLCWVVYGTVLLEMRARAGEAEAQYRFGKRKLAVGVTPQDRATASKWIDLAAEQGYAKAQTALGVYAKGTGSPRDLEQSLNWFTKAAMQGDTVAQNELAAMYMTGKGVTRDLRKAIHWSASAAAKGSQIARVNLVVAQAARSNSMGDLTTRSGNRYRKVCLRTIESDGIMIAYDSGKGGVGLARLKRDDLPDNLRELCRYSSKTNAAKAGFVPWL